MAESNKSVKHDVMVSYSWGSQETVLKIREQLREAGLSCWIDVEQMSGSIVEAMSAAVENCSVFLMCYSEGYSKSRSCKSEAEYATTLQKIIIPCKMERNYNPTGWLGFLIGSRLFFDFSGVYPFEKKMEDLLREINIHLKRNSPGALAKEIQNSLKTDDAVGNKEAGNSKIVKEITINNAEGVRHIVFFPPDKFWIGNEKSIALISGTGEKLNEIQRSYRFTFGAHSVTKEGFLVYLSHKFVKRRISDTNTEKLFTTTNVDGWKARSIFASHRTENIIVGLQKEEKGIGKLSVYDKEGNHQQTIEKNANDKPLYTLPRYITDNVNGDLVTSDKYGGIVVIDQSGNHRFTYNLSKPRAVVTDSHGRIFGCNKTPTIHVIDKDGKFLMNIHTGSKDIFGLYLHQDTELYTGFDSAKKIVVYKV